MPNDAIFDDNDLKAAAQLVAGSMLDSLPSRAECEHEFSDDFTAKMDKLLHRQKRQIWYTVIRYAAVIVLTATLALGTVMAASPTARAAVLKWTRELYDAGTVYRFYSEVSDAPLPAYELGRLPEGFEETSVYRSNSFCRAMYSNAETGKSFVFEYSYMNIGTVQTVTSGNEDSVEQTKVNGMPADFYRLRKAKYISALLIFDEENDIYFSITGTLDRDSIFDIAEHIYLKGETEK